MDTQELTVRGADKVVAYFCGKCKYVRPTKEAADECCVPVHCACGAEIQINSFMGKCTDCQRNDFFESERKQFEKARKVSWRDYDGALSDGEGGYWFNNESVLDDFFEGLPEYLWACEPEGMSIDAVDVVEDALTDHHEGAFDQCDVDGLQKMLDEWVKKQGIISWYPDYKTAVLLDGLEEELGE